MTFPDKHRNRRKRLGFNPRFLWHIDPWWVRTREDARRRARGNGAATAWLPGAPSRRLRKRRCTK